MVYLFPILICFFTLIWQVLKEVFNSSSSKQYDPDFANTRESILQVTCNKTICCFMGKSDICLQRRFSPYERCHVCAD